jgi:hypothetical protein
MKQTPFRIIEEMGHGADMEELDSYYKHILKIAVE